MAPNRPEESRPRDKANEVSNKEDVGDKLSRYMTERTPDIAGAEPMMRVGVMDKKAAEFENRVAALNLPMITDKDGNFIKWDGKKFTDDQANAVKQITGEIDQQVASIQGHVANLTTSLARTETNRALDEASPMQS